MTVSRRKFLRHGMIAAAATCASSSLLGSSKPLGKDEGKTIRTPLKPPVQSNTDWHNHADGMQHLTRESFNGAVGSTFKVFDRSGKIAPSWVTLLSVSDLPALAPVNPASFAVPNKLPSHGLVSTGFVLFFRGSAPAPLPQDTFLLEHSGLGQFALFLVPEGNGQQLYIAVVNRLSGNLHTQFPMVATPVTDRQTPQAGLGSGESIVAPVGARTARPATTSSGSGDLQSVPSGTQDVRRGPAQD